jgi:hypothetical protein
MQTWTITQKTPTDNGNDVKAEYGLISIDSDLEALRTQIECNLQVVKGEVPDEDKGVDYFGIIYANTPLSMKIQELTRVISNIDGVEDVHFLKAEKNQKTHTLSFYFEIQSVYGVLEYNKNIENIG